MKKIYTLLIVLFPLLSVYASPIPGISLAEIFLFIIWGIILIDALSKKYINVNIILPLALFSFYISIQYLISEIVHDSVYMEGIGMRTFHILFYYVTIIFLTKKYFDINLGLKYLKNTSVFCSIYVIIQTIFMKIFGFYLSGVIPWLPLMRSTLATHGEYYVKGTFFRPYSLFNEPAEYSTYVVLYLLIGLLRKKSYVKSYTSEVIITIGLLLSGSSTGIIMCIVIWIMHIVVKLYNTRRVKKQSILKLFLFIPIFTVGLVNIFRTEYIKVFLERTFDSSGGLGGAALGRFSGYEVLVELLNKSDWYWFFGRAMNRQYTNGLHIYIPGMGSMLNYFGLMGCILFVYIGIYLIRKTSFMNICIYLLMIIVGVGSDATFSVFSITYFTFMFLNYSNNSNIYGIKIGEKNGN